MRKNIIYLNLGTYRLGKFVRIDAKDISVPVRNRSASIAEKHHDVVVSLSVMIKITIR